MELTDNHAITPDILIRGIPSILLVFKEDGQLATWNREAAESLGLGQPGNSEGQAELSDELLSVVRSCMDLKEMMRLDECTMEVAGAKRKFGFTANPLYSDNAVLGAVVTGRDITERVIVSAEIEELKRRAGIEKVARQLAHELRNPLNSLKVHAQFIELLFQDDDVNRRYAAVIGEEVDHMDRLLTSLKDLSHAQDLDLRYGAPEAAISQACDLMSAVAKSKGVDIKARIGNLPSVLFDSAKIQQVLLNLLKNAVEAVKPGGNVLVLAGGTDQSGVFVEVLDDGPGIDPKVADQIFNLFFTTKGRSGEGIGLAVCREILEGHRGRIFLARKEGWSTCLRLEIPPP